MRLNKIQNVIAAAVLAAGTLMMPSLTEARAHIYVNVAPPAPLVEEVPAPRYGYTWAPGYWRWNGHRHMWAHGYWVRAYPGRHWVGHRWVRSGNGWYFRDGYRARG